MWKRMVPPKLLLFITLLTINVGRSFHVIPLGVGLLSPRGWNYNKRTFHKLIVSAAATAFDGGDGSPTPAMDTTIGASKGRTDANDDGDNDESQLSAAVIPKELSSDKVDGKNETSGGYSSAIEELNALWLETAQQMDEMKSKKPTTTPPLESFVEGAVHEAIKELGLRGYDIDKEKLLGNKDLASKIKNIVDEEVRSFSVIATKIHNEKVQEMHQYVEKVTNLAAALSENENDIFMREQELDPVSSELDESFSNITKRIEDAINFEENFLLNETTILDRFVEGGNVVKCVFAGFLLFTVRCINEIGGYLCGYSPDLTPALREGMVSAGFLAVLLVLLYRKQGNQVNHGPETSKENPDSSPVLIPTKEVSKQNGS